jgi:hypothetical protein
MIEARDSILFILETTDAVTNSLQQNMQCIVYLFCNNVLFDANIFVIGLYTMFFCYLTGLPTVTNRSACKLEQLSISNAHKPRSPSQNWSE